MHESYIRIIVDLVKTESIWWLVPTGEIESLPGHRLTRGELTIDDFQVAHNESGAFRDEDIVKVLLEATDNVASAFKARAIPEVMRAIDLLGMEAARKTWRCCTMNEFREFLGLKKYASFEDRNPDKDVARAAEKLYKHVDHLELYPGLMAEEPQPLMNGSGLALGYSILRGILSDAVALVRGDRFFTTDYNAGNLTSAMWEDLKPELDNGSFGGVIGKLLVRRFSACSPPSRARADPLLPRPLARPPAASTRPSRSSSATVRKHSELLRGIILMRLGQTEFIPDLAADLLRDFKRVLTGKGSGGYILSDRSRKMYKRVTQSDRPIDELAGVLLTSLIRLAQVVPQVADGVDFFLEPSRQKDFERAAPLSRRSAWPTTRSSSCVDLKYVLEAMPLQPAVTGIVRRVEADSDKTANGLTWVDLAACGRDDKVFAEPDKVEPTRNAAFCKPLDEGTSVVNHEDESYNVPLVTGIVRELFTVNSPSRPSGSEDQLGLIEGPLGLRIYSCEETRERPRAFLGRMVIEFNGIKAKRRGGSSREEGGGWTRACLSPRSVPLRAA
ncbi:hypothetical protein JCM9279_000869 [Rhodotorula babjevae]